MPRRSFVSVARARLNGMAQSKTDSFSDYDQLLAEADLETSPWEGDVYLPDYDLFRKMLAIPIEAGHATKQQSGRMAKALDAWIAHELRRAGFPPQAVWPRARQPRVRSGEIADLESRIDDLLAILEEVEDE